MTTTKGGRGLAFITALMTSLTLHLAVADYTTYTPELKAKAGALRGLRTILQREKAWFRDNQAYATTLEELGDDLALDPHWHFEIVAAQTNGRPILMIEADNGRTRLCINEKGHFFESSAKALPPFPAWSREEVQTEHENE